MNVSLEYLVGVIVGFVVGAIIFGLLKMLSKKKNGPPKYDERQQALRGRAYGVAFWCLVAYLIMNGVLDTAGIRWAAPMAAAFIGICFAITVFVVVCVFSDAYFAVNQRPRLYMGLFAFLFVLNALIVALNLMDGNDLLSDGLLNYRAMNAVIVVVFFILFVSIAAKTLIEKRRGGGEQ